MMFKAKAGDQNWLLVLSFLLIASFLITPAFATIFYEYEWGGDKYPYMIVCSNDSNDPLNFEKIYEIFKENPPTNEFSNYAEGYITIPYDSPNHWLTSTQPETYLKWACEGNCTIESDGNQIIVTSTDGTPFNVSILTTTYQVNSYRYLHNWLPYGINYSIVSDSQFTLNWAKEYAPWSNHRYYTTPQGYEDNINYIGWVKWNVNTTTTSITDTLWFINKTLAQYDIYSRNLDMEIDPKDISRYHARPYPDPGCRTNWQLDTWAMIQFHITPSYAGQKINITRLYFWSRPHFKQIDEKTYMTNLVIRISPSEFGQSHCYFDSKFENFYFHRLAVSKSTFNTYHDNLYITTLSNFYYYNIHRFEFSDSNISLNYTNFLTYVFPNFFAGWGKIVSWGNNYFEFEHGRVGRYTERSSINLCSEKKIYLNDLTFETSQEAPIWLGGSVDNLYISNINLRGWLYPITGSHNFLYAFEVSGAGDFEYHNLNPEPNSISTMSRIYNYPGTVYDYGISDEVWRLATSGVSHWLIPNYARYPNEFVHLLSNIHVKVTDNNNNPIPGATVELISKKTGESYKAYTDSNGNALVNPEILYFYTHACDGKKVYVTDYDNSNPNCWYIKSGTNTGLQVGDYVTFSCENYKNIRSLSPSPYPCIQWNLRATKITSINDTMICVDKQPTWKYHINYTKAGGTFNLQEGSSYPYSCMTIINKLPYLVKIYKPGYQPIFLTYNTYKDQDWQFELVKGTRSIYPWAFVVLKWDRANAFDINQTFDVSLYAYKPDYSAQEGLTCSGGVYELGNSTEMYSFNFTEIGSGLYTAHVDLSNQSEALAGKNLVILATCTDGNFTYSNARQFSYGVPQYVGMVYNQYPCNFTIYDNGTTLNVEGLEWDIGNFTYCYYKYDTSTDFVTWEAFDSNERSGFFGAVANVNFSKPAKLLEALIGDLNNAYSVYVFLALAITFIIIGFITYVPHVRIAMFFFADVLLIIASVYGGILGIVNWDVISPGVTVLIALLFAFVTWFMYKLYLALKEALIRD